MSMLITHSDAKRAIEVAKSAQSRLRHYKEKGEEITEGFVRTLVTTGTGFGLGVVAGAGIFQNGEIMKVPIELGAGLLFHALRIAGFAGKKGGVLSDMGDGALTSYFHILGRGVGAQHWGTKRPAATMGGSLADRLSRLAAQT